MVTILQDGEHTYLKTERNELYRDSLFQSVIGVILLFSSIVFQSYIGVIPSAVLTIIGGILALRGGFSGKKGTMFQKGIVGEDIVKEELEMLNDDYFVIHDLKPHPKSENIDHVVVGPNGIFTLETKNYSGYVRNDGEDWFYVSRNGNRIIHDVGKQARRQSKILRTILKQRLRNTPDSSLDITPVIVFVNQDLSLSGQRTDLLIASDQDVCQRIMSYQGGGWLSEEQVMEIAFSLT